MRSVLRKGSKGLLIGIAALVAAAIVLAVIPARTPRIEGQDAVASLETIELGGVEQWVLIRGRDRTNPVLLYLHGGPGSAMMPFSRRFSGRLEQHFVVVHWDQRGAGKSCSSEVPNESLTLPQYLDDTHELVQRLRHRFHAEKIYLLGHSWGSVLGTLTVQRYPELFHAYIGLGQVVSNTRGEQVSYDFVVDSAKAEGNEHALAELRKIKPPYRDLRELMTQRRWLSYYRGDVFSGGGKWRFAPLVVLSPEYSLREKLSYMRCLSNALEHSPKENEDLDFAESAPHLEAPVYFFAGRHDYNAPSQLVEEYLAVLEAPRKEIVWFEHSAHEIPLEEPERFQDELIDRVLADTYPTS